MHKNKTKNNLAFTIVELLIVIVIIGILAAITIISYRGITQRSIDATIQADLSNSSKKLKMYYALYNVYPVDMQSSDGGKTYCPTGPSADTNYCIKPSNGNVFTYSQLSAGQDFSLTVTKGSVSYITTKDAGPIAGSATGSSFAKTWGGSGVEYANSLAQSSDGGYVVTGSTTSFGAGSTDAFFVKYDSSGNLVWNKTWGGAGIDIAQGVIKTSDGGYALAGYTNSYGAGGYDAFLLKYDSSGNLVWNKTWGGAVADAAWNLIQTSDSGYALIGYTASYSVGSEDAFLIKYDISGNLTWSKTWGGTSGDGFYSVAQTADGGYAATGSTASFGAGSNEIILAKFNSSGNLVWNKTWGGSNLDIAYGLVRSNDDGLALAGLTGSYGAGGVDAIILKYDSSGNLVWNKTWGGSGGDGFYEIAQVSDNGFVLAGYSSSFGAASNEAALVKYDSSGNLMWSRTWGGTGFEYTLDLVKSDDGYAIVGQTDGYGAGNYDTFLLKFKSDGSMNNCTSPMCQSPTATITTPAAGVTTPSASVTSPSATVATPAATVTTPTATVTTVVAP